MLINLSIYCGANRSTSTVGEGRVLLDALRFYENELIRTGCANHKGDGPTTLAALLSVSLSLNEGMLNELEKLTEKIVSTGTKLDGSPEYKTVYYPHVPTDALDVFTRSVVELIEDGGFVTKKNEFEPGTDRPAARL